MVSALALSLSIDSVVCKQRNPTHDQGAPSGPESRCAMRMGPHALLRIDEKVLKESPFLSIPRVRMSDAQ